MVFLTSVLCDIAAATGVLVWAAGGAPWHPVVEAVLSGDGALRR